MIETLSVDLGSPPPDSNESAGRRKRYKCDRVIPTKRDLELLNDLYQSVVLSLRQIKVLHFLEANKCTMLNRLKRLEEGGLVRRFRVTNFRDTIGTHDVGTVFQITRSGIMVLQKMHPNQCFRTIPPSISFLSLQHDLTVNEVQWALMKRFPQVSFINGRLVEGGDKAINLPDIFGKLDGGEFAIEVELTAKSEKRYRELLLNYQVVNRFESILYVTGSDSIKHKVQDVALGYRRHAGHMRADVDTGAIYFVDLKDLLTNPQGARITNGALEFNPQPKGNI